ncbi:MAG TPA: hypothetical protein VIL85_22800 [Thermomicrobiales bacterium]
MTDWMPPFSAAEDDDAERYNERQGGRGRTMSVSPTPVAWYVPFTGRLLMFFALGLIAAAVFGGLFSISNTVSKTVPYVIPITTDHPTVHIDSAASRISVVPIATGDAAKANTVTVEAVTEVRNFSRFQAQRDLDHATLGLEARGDDIYINTQPDGEGSFVFERSTRVTVYAPLGSAIDLRLQAGTASIRGINGRVTVDLSGGNLDLLDVALGDRSAIVLKGGNIDLDGQLQAGASLNVDVSGGNANLRLPLRTEARLNASAEAGNLDIVGWGEGITTTRSRNGSSSINGFLYRDPQAQSLITLRVNGGNISLHPAVDLASAAPAIPTVPPVPTIPALPAKR